MSVYKVEICGVNTAKLPILKEEEKEELFRRIKQGDTDAREAYIKGNLRLVLSVIKRFSGNHENIDDLFQIGCIGLIKSIDNFDDTLGVKFSTYAVPMIVGEIRRYLRDNNSIRVSRSLRDTAYKAIHAREILQKNSMQEPTLDEIAKEAGIPKEDIVYALDAIQSPLIRCHVPLERTRELYHKPAFFSGQNTDGGRRRNPHLPSTGKPSGKIRPKEHAQLSVSKKITYKICPNLPLPCSEKQVIS